MAILLYRVRVDAIRIDVSQRKASSAEAAASTQKAAVDLRAVGYAKCLAQAFNRHLGAVRSALTRWKQSSVGDALARREQAALGIQAAVRRHWGRHRHQGLTEQQWAAELDYKRPKDIEEACAKRKVDHDVRRAAERWEDAVEVLEKVQELWRRECPDVYQGGHPADEVACLGQLDALTTQLKPWQHAHFRDLASKRGTPEDPFATWHCEANHRLFRRVQRSKLLVRAAWGCLPRREASSDRADRALPNIELPDLEIPDIQMPEVQLPKMPWSSSEQQV